MGRGNDQGWKTRRRGDRRKERTDVVNVFGKDGKETGEEKEEMSYEVSNGD